MALSRSWCGVDLHRFRGANGDHAMRIAFPNLVRPKKAAKHLHALTADISLSMCQAAIAAACGYRDWHDLETHGVGDGSLLDQNLPLAERGDRNVFQAERI